MWFGLIGILLVAGVAIGDDFLDEPSTYDQRQVGKTNVRLSVKDAVVIALGDGQQFGGDYDYSYDYSDLTIKPPMSVFSTSSTQRPATTFRPSTESSSLSTSTKTTTAAAQSTKSTPPKSQIKTTTTQTYSSTSRSTSSSEVDDKIVFTPKTNESSTPHISEPPKNFQISSPHPDQIPALVLQELLGTLPYKFLSRKPGKRSPLNRSAINPEFLLRRHCSPGYFLDNHNRCKKIIQKPIVSL